MAKVYVLSQDGSTEEMAGIHCVNEDLELQRILEVNPDLVPGDQISPSDPRRWLIVKREMPVPDPCTGENRWSIDLFFVDQDAMPTFVECKRYNDTRARREVVGQMIEYAANGHHYWTKDEIRKYAEDAAEQKGVSLEDEIRRLQPEDPVSIDEFFQHVQDNLRDGQVRLVFFMEEAPSELKSLVEFLNKQMERSEVLLVEARQYEHHGTKIVAPTLFGYTEAARQVKRTYSATNRKKRRWDRDSFFSDARDHLTDTELNSIRLFLEKSRELKSDITWGSGKITGSFSVKWPHISRYSVFSVFSDGTFTINFGNFKEQPEFSTFLKNQIASNLGFPVPDEYEGRYLNIKIETWAPKIEAILTALESLTAEFPEPDRI